MLFKLMRAVSSKNRMTHMKTVCGVKCRDIDVKISGTLTNHWASKG
jgi:hypothetical protein